MVYANICLIETLFMIGMILYLLGSLIILYSFYKQKKRHKRRDVDGFTVSLFFLFFAFSFPFYINTPACKIGSYLIYFWIIACVLTIAVMIALTIKILEEK